MPKKGRGSKFSSKREGRKDKERKINEQRKDGDSEVGDCENMESEIGSEFGDKNLERESEIGTQFRDECIDLEMENSQENNMCGESESEMRMNLSILSNITKAKRGRKKGRTSVATKVREQKKRNKGKKDSDTNSVSSSMSNLTAQSSRKRKGPPVTPSLDTLSLHSPQPTKRRSKNVSDDRSSMPPPSGPITRSRRSVSIRRSLSPVQNNIVDNLNGAEYWELPMARDPLLIIDQYPLDLADETQSAEAFLIQNSSLAQARELQRIINAHNNKRFRNDDYSKDFDFFCICAYLEWLKELLETHVPLNERCRITVVRKFAGDLLARLARDQQVHTHELLYGTPETSEYIVIPYLNIQGQNFARSNGHYGLGIYETNGGRLLYFDSLERENPDVVRQKMQEVLDTIYSPNERNLHPPMVINDFVYCQSAANEVNRQNDGFSCGFLVCLNAEMFLFRVRHSQLDHMRIHNLDIAHYTAKVLNVVQKLLQNILVPFVAFHPENFTIGRNFDDVIPSRPFDLIQQPQVVGQNLNGNQQDHDNESQTQSLSNQMTTDDLTNNLQNPRFQASINLDNRRKRDQRKRFQTHQQKKKRGPCDGTSHPGWGCGSLAAFEKGCPCSEGELHSVGEFSELCVFCDALLLIGEKCPCGGKFKFKPQEYDPLPLLFLKSPNNNDHVQAKCFKSNATLYNTLLQFASVTYHSKGSAVQRQPPVCKINGKITHQLGPLISGANRPPAFQGLYIRDEVEAEQRRKDILQNNNLGADADSRIDFALLGLLDRMLRECNPIAKDLKKGHDYYEQVVAEAIEKNEKIPEVEMRILSRREVPQSILDPTIHPHQMNISTNPLEVSAIWISGQGEPPSVHGTRVVIHGDGLKQLRYFDPNVQALCYPLIHPRGEQFFHDKIKLNDCTMDDDLLAILEEEENVIVTDLADAAIDPMDATVAVDLARNVDASEEGMEIGDMPGALDPVGQKKKGNIGPRKFASRRQVLRSFLHLRPRNKLQPEKISRCEHPLWGLRKLAQKWLLDQVWTFEAQEADYIKKHVQKNLRWELPSKFIEAIKKGLKPNQKLGHVFKAPKTWKGSPQHMSQAYTKAMAIFRRLGKPTFMVTFTGNPKWKEVVEGMYDDGQICADRPDIICRVFEQKVKRAREKLEDEGLLGKCIAHVESREFQDKGCPHFHKLLTIDPKSLPPGVDINSAEFCEQYISAEIPPEPSDEDWENRPEWAEEQQNYRESVIKYMIHTCTEDSICRRDGRCSKGFPKQFSDQTIVYDNRPVVYKRRNNGEKVQKKVGNVVREFDNRYVVPHNRKLLLDFGCHINVERVWGLGAGKYALKYVTKGREVAYVIISAKTGKPVNTRTQHVTNDQNADPTEEEDVIFDEFEQIFQTQFMTPQESWTRANSIPIVRLSHTVYHLSVHKPDGDPIVYPEGREIEVAQRSHLKGRNSKFIGYMNLCKIDKEACEYTYEEICTKYVWHKDKRDENGLKGVWLPEKRARLGVIGNIYTVFPTDPELFAIRILAIHRKGYPTLEDLRTVNGVLYKTFVEAARALGLLDDIELWRATMKEVCDHVTNRQQVARFYAQLVLFSCQLYAKELFEEFVSYMIGSPLENLSPATIEIRIEKLLRYISYIFAQANRSCSDFGIPEPKAHNPQEDIDMFFFGDDDGNDGNGQTKGSRKYGMLNVEQKDVVDTLEKVSNEIRTSPGDEDIQRLYYLNGDGGHGKSFTVETLLLRARESIATERRHILPMASTGIAAAILTGATTLHSAFRLPLSRLANEVPNIRWQELQGQRIRAAEILIIDEVSMVETRLLNMVDRSCRDLEPHYAKKKMPFGGKVVLIVGDWKQLLPVIRGKSIQEQAMASFRSSDLYKKFHEFKLTQNMRMTAGQEEYKKFVDDVGHGRNFIIVNGMETDRVEIPDEIRTVNTANDLLEEVFPQHICDLAVSNDRSEQVSFAQNVILSTTNIIVDDFNEQIIERIPGQDREYLSVDKPVLENPLDTVYQADRQPENLNQVESGSLPRHSMKVKKGAVVMLLRNISVAYGLCNGSRFIVEEMGENVIWCRRLNASGELDEDKVAIARFNFDYDDSDYDRTGLQFSRVQFPLKLASALTINKAQGQTIPGKLGIDLRKDIFSPGMLYVSLTRAKEANNVTILTNFAGDVRPTMKNIVWDFDNPNRFFRPMPPPVPIPQLDETDDEDNANAAFDFDLDINAEIRNNDNQPIQGFNFDNDSQVQENTNTQPQAFSFGEIDHGNNNGKNNNELEQNELNENENFMEMDNMILEEEEHHELEDPGSDAEETHTTPSNQSRLLIVNIANRDDPRIEGNIENDENAATQSRGNASGIRYLYTSESTKAISIGQLGKMVLAYLISKEKRGELAKNSTFKWEKIVEKIVVDRARWTRLNRYLLKILEALEILEKKDREDQLSEYLWKGLDAMPTLMASLKSKAEAMQMAQKISFIEKKLRKSHSTFAIKTEECKIFEKKPNGIGGQKMVHQMCRRFLMILLSDHMEWAFGSDILCLLMGFELKCRRTLCDVLNVLTELKLVKKLHFTTAASKIPIYAYSGPKPDANPLTATDEMRHFQSRLNFMQNLTAAAENLRNGLPTKRNDEEGTSSKDTKHEDLAELRHCLEQTFQWAPQMEPPPSPAPSSSSTGTIAAEIYDDGDVGDNDPNIISNSQMPQTPSKATIINMIQTSEIRHPNFHQLNFMPIIAENSLQMMGGVNAVGEMEFVDCQRPDCFADVGAETVIGVEEDAEKMLDMTDEMEEIKGEQNDWFELSEDAVGFSGKFICPQRQQNQESNQNHRFMPTTTRNGQFLPTTTLTTSNSSQASIEHIEETEEQKVLISSKGSVDVDSVPTGNHKTPRNQRTHLKRNQRHVTKANLATNTESNVSIWESAQNNTIFRQIMTSSQISSDKANRTTNLSSYSCARFIPYNVSTHQHVQNSTENIALIRKVERTDSGPTPARKSKNAAIIRQIVTPAPNSYKNDNRARNRPSNCERTQNSRMTATDLYKRKNVFNLAPAPSSSNVLATEVKPKFQSMDEEIVTDSAMMVTTENESAIVDEADDRRQLEIPSQLHRSFGHKNQRKRRFNRSNNPQLAKRQRPSEFNNRNDSAKNSINSNKSASVFSNSYSTPFNRGRGRPFGSTKQEILRRKLQKRIAKEMRQNNVATKNGNNSNLPRNNENDEAVAPAPRFQLNNFDFEQLELLGAEWGLRLQKRGQHLLFFKPLKQSAESKITRILRHTTMGLLLIDNGDHIQVDECEFVVADGSYRPNSMPTDRWYKGSASAKKFLRRLYKKMVECFKDEASK